MACILVPVNSDHPDAERTSLPRHLPLVDVRASDSTPPAPPSSLRDDPCSLSTLSSRRPHRLLPSRTRGAACPRCPSGWCARDQRRGGRTSSSPVSVDLRVPRAWRPAVVVVLSTADGVELPSGPHVRDTRSSTEPAERASRRLAARFAAASRHVRAGAVLVLLQVPQARHNHRSCRLCVFM